jgi:hypothetical protein
MLRIKTEPGAMLGKMTGELCKQIFEFYYFLKFVKNRKKWKKF